MKRKKSTLKVVTEKAKRIVKGQKYQVLSKEKKYHNLEGVEILYPTFCVTDDYELFNKQRKNRPITHAKMMDDSVSTLGKVLRPIVVSNLNGKFHILDGQNLFEALKSKGLPIYFYLFNVSTESEEIKIMKKMNCSARRWSLNQFVRVNTTDDKKTNAHDKLLDYLEKYKRSVGMTIKVMSALMYNEDNYNENRAANAVKGDYFVQNVPDIRVKQRLTSLKKFYRATNMTPTNCLNAAYIELLYDKKDIFYKVEKRYLNSLTAYVNRHNLTCYKFGNKKDAWTLLTAAWKNMNK